MDKIKFHNYLLDIAIADKSRVAIGNRHYTHFFGAEDIIIKCCKEIGKEIKASAPNFLKDKLNLPKSTIECWIYGSNSFPILRAYEILKIWKKVCKKSKKEFD